MTNKHTSGRLFSRLVRLGRQDDAEFLAILIAARNAVANDNLPPPDGMSVDSIMEIRPTPNEVIAASKPDESGEIGLRFNAKGELIEWRPVDNDGNPVIGKDGNQFWLKPVDRYRHAKGGRRKTGKDLSSDDTSHANWIMSLRGTGTMPPAWVSDTRYQSVCGMFLRLAAAVVGFVMPSKNREFLASYGVDGTRSLEQCAESNPQAAVKRCRPGMAYKVEFLCGKPDSGGTATEGSFVGAPDAAEMTMIAAIDADGSYEKMPIVLEMALLGMTMKEIAKARNWGDTKQAERKAVLEVDAAIAELRRAA